MKWLLFSRGVIKKTVKMAARGTFKFPFKNVSLKLTFCPPFSPAVLAHSVRILNVQQASFSPARGSIGSRWITYLHTGWAQEAFLATLGHHHA
jgi:hypothetical protein